MYSWEIEKLLAEKNNIITRDDFYKIINKVDNPQIKDVKTEPMFKIETSDRYEFHVRVE